MRPRRIVYLLPLVFLVAAGIPSGAVMWDGIEGLRSPLKRMLGPGNEHVPFDRDGEWTVFYEYRGTVDGRTISASPSPPSLEIKLTSPSGGELEASPTSVPLTYQTGRSAGVSVASFTLDDPGLYTVAVTSSTSDEEMVVAFGHEKARSLRRVISGAVLLGATVLVGLIGLGVVFFLRVRSKRRARLAAPAPGMPPPPPGF